jgi:hypothetical protein
MPSDPRDDDVTQGPAAGPTRSVTPCVARGGMGEVEQPVALKFLPEGVMIDWTGKVRIRDFGIATAAGDASTLQELKTLHDRGNVTTPSSIVRDLDLAIERVILR